MTDPELQKKGENLLLAIARRAIDYARAGNKSGLIRLRYLAREITDLLPFSRRLRLSHHRDDPAEVSSDVELRISRPTRH